MTSSASGIKLFGVQYHSSESLAAISATRSALSASTDMTGYFVCGAAAAVLDAWP